MKKNKGFTLIELMVSLAIFAFMTAFLLSKYGTFNQSTLIINLAYDTALTIRSAQSYGLNVQGNVSSSCASGFSSGNLCFAYPYGVDFNMNYTNQFTLFTDLNNTGEYSSSTAEAVSIYRMNTGYHIFSLCAGSAPGASCIPASTLDITFKRPIPDAIIMANISPAPLQYAQIVLTANNATSSVSIYSTGEISVQN